MWIKNTYFGEILPSYHSLSQNNEFLRRRIQALGNSKTCFCWFTATTQSLKNLGKISEYLAYEILHRPDSWQGFLYILWVVVHGRS